MKFHAPFQLTVEDFSLVGMPDLLVVPGFDDLERARKWAARLSRMDCHTWVEDANGTKIFEAGPVRNLTHQFR